VERLILARHAETDWNVRQLVNGDPAVAVVLTERGRDEAQELGEELADEPIDLCVVTPFGRTAETAELALAGREVPRLVVAELGDPAYGSFEGSSLQAYREWAWSNPSSTVPPGGGEARAAIVERYARAFRRLLALEQEVVLAVCHSLPVAYAIAGRDGEAPAPKVPLVQNAHPYRFTRAELERVADLLEGWCASPSW
jgi:broad specificity phosphatase PhoE